MPYGSVGGMERLALNFYNHYKSKGFEVTAVKIIQLNSDIIHFGSDEIALSTIDFNQMSFVKRLLFYFKIPFLLRKIIKQNRVTHSISFGDMANIFSSLTFTEEFKVASIHALKSVEFQAKSFLNRIFKLGFKTSYCFFDKVVSISAAIQRDLLEQCGYRFPKNLEVIYNPHDVNMIEKLSQEPFEDLNERELFEKDVVLFLGRLTHQKAPWHLVKAFSLIKDEKVKLVFIGDGSSDVTDYLTDLIDQLGIKERIVFLGRKSNPYKYLKRAKILALSSYFEGTPNVIVEAIAVNVPIVSSNCTDGIQELMSTGTNREDSEIIETESGIITPTFFKGNLSFPSDNAITDEEQVFADCLLKILNSGRYKAQLVSNRNQLLSKFDMNKVAVSYLEKNK